MGLKEYHDLKSTRMGRAMVKVRKDTVGWERLISHLEVQSCILITFYIPTVFILLCCKLNIRFSPSVINLPFPALCVSSLDVYVSLFKANRKLL